MDNNKIFEKVKMKIAISNVKEEDIVMDKRKLNMFYINISKPYSKIIPEMDVYYGRWMNVIKSEFYFLRKGGKSY